MAPTPVEIAAWLACLVAVVMGANQVFKLLDRFKEHPPPRDTYQLKGEYVTRRELDALSDELDDLAVLLRDQVAKLQDQFRDQVAKLQDQMKHDAEVANAGATARAEKTHGRIDEVLSAMGDLRERIGDRR